MATEENETQLVLVPIRDIKKGDVLPGHWTALEDAANLHDSFCSIKIQWFDGAVDLREWFDPDHQIEVERMTDPPAGVGG